MKTYNYELTTTNGSASGCVQAESEADAKKQLEADYTGSYTDKKGKKQESGIQSLVLTERPA